jgi:GNAT superfamily N-acetyltransferase
MKPNLPKIELRISHDPVHFLPLLCEIDLGDPFILSMMHWCGIGKRATPLDFWQVYLIEFENQIVGVTGLYRQPDTPKNILWLGWTGLRPDYRRRGIGSAVLAEIEKDVAKQNCSELWVYTGKDDFTASAFYSSLGFGCIGAAHAHAIGRTAKPDDWVFKKTMRTL